MKISGSSDSSLQWRVVLYCALPFALASLLVYVAAAREFLIHPHGPAILSETVLDLGLKTFFGMGLWLAPLAIPRISPRVYLWAAAPILCLLFLPNMMYALEYRELISIGAVEALLSTNSQETREFIADRSDSIVLTALMCLAVAGSFAWAQWAIVRRGARLLGSGRLAVGAVAVVILAVGVATRPRVFPITSIKNAAEYYSYLNEMDRLADSRATFAFGASRVREIDAAETYVVIIGESMRRRQLSHYGYGRLTTPRLDTTSNMVFLQDVISATGTSQSAVKAALTPATAATVHESTYPSILRVANEVGFSTAWISNQDRVVDTEIALIADEADTTVFTNHDWAASGNYDEAVLEPLASALAGSAEKKLIVVHLMGNHAEYWRRYPDSFEQFTSTDCKTLPIGCERGLTSEEIATINEYDNSITYTDWIVREIIGQVEKEAGASAVLFFSDHGEELFDSRVSRIGHGFHDMTSHEVEIPAFVWLSPTLNRIRPDVAAAVAANRFRRTTSEDFFHAIADMLGADFPMHQRTRSILRQGYEEKKRFVAGPDRKLVEFSCLKLPSRECSRFTVESLVTAGWLSAGDLQRRPNPAS